MVLTGLTPGRVTALLRVSPARRPPGRAYPGEGRAGTWPARGYAERNLGSVKLPRCMTGLVSPAGPRTGGDRAGASRTVEAAHDPRCPGGRGSVGLAGVHDSA